MSITTTPEVTSEVIRALVEAGRTDLILALMTPDAPAKASKPNVAAPLTRPRRADGTFLPKGASPKVAPKAKKARKASTKARKVEAPKVEAPKVIYLTQAHRKAFIAAQKAQGIGDFTGFSTKDLVQACIAAEFAGECIIPEGFEVGPGYRALYG